MLSHKKIEMILLINPKTTKPSEFQSEYFREPNLGLLYLSSVLDRNGIDVDILDLEQYFTLSKEDLEQILKELSLKYHIFGITCLTNTYEISISLARLIKKNNPDAIIVFGGPHVSFLYNKILQVESVIDYICVGEAEKSFLQLSKLLIGYSLNKNSNYKDFTRKLQLIPGLAYRESHGKVFFTGNPEVVDLEALSLPARYKLSQDNYYYRVANVIVNRGCPNECSFCSRQNFFQDVRIRSIGSILAEIREIIALQNYEYINFYDNININKKFFHEFCNIFTENQIIIPWGCELRVDAIQREDAKLLKEAGCQLIATGIESASQDVLKINFKYQEPELVLKGLKHLKSQGIAVQCYFVLGLPGETKATFQKTIDYIKNLPLDQEDKLEYFAATPYPGSKLWKNREEYQIRIIETDFSKYDCQHIIFETPDLNFQQLNDMFKTAKELENYHGTE
ncbi:MAG: radical SAM protein [Promethearchaeota archaeon]|nr:MAG: radical SAM protein [Candidatus Lokiarchaeota archaeon]